MQKQLKFDKLDWEILNILSRSNKPLTESDIAKTLKIHGAYVGYHTKKLYSFGILKKKVVDGRRLYSLDIEKNVICAYSGGLIIFPKDGGNIFVTYCPYANKCKFHKEGIGFNEECDLFKELFLTKSGKPNTIFKKVIKELYKNGKK